MELSEEELRLLEQMERALVEEDPKFASTLRGTSFQRTARRRMILGGVILAGLPFSTALIGILLAHEMGHYLTAKRYAINASPPYFLPAPIEFNFIGTFGAFIRLRTPVIDRRQLMDVGAAGPWVGFAVALLMLIVGVQSEDATTAQPSSVTFNGTPLALVNSKSAGTTTYQNVSLWYLAAPAVVTGNVVVTWPAAVGNATAGATVSTVKVLEAEPMFPAASVEATA